MAGFYLFVSNLFNFILFVFVLQLWHRYKIIVVSKVISFQQLDKENVV